ncbi:CHAD domain-containing protein [Pseudomonas stutzeri]|nr:CHAD domain-containing protein [Stutzerimonas stutzeri]
MTALANRLIARFIALDVALVATRARLAACTDREALHDLRIVVRRLRSLLRPLRGLPGVDSLEALAAEVGRLSSPLRDLEVLAEELERFGAAEPARRRREVLAAAYPQLLGEAALARLQHALGQWPGLLREAEREGLLRRWQKKVHRRLLGQRQRLQIALVDPAHDRHRLRLLVKRVRYASEVWPQPLGVPADALKAAQSALGDWHDRLQWCRRAEEEEDLRPCLGHWQRELTAAEVEADAALLLLQQRLLHGR